MKVATESKNNEEVWVKPMEFELSKGLIGFQDVTQYELLVNSEELPFMWIRGRDRHELGFVVIEPSQFMNDYEVELSDDDVAALEIQSEKDALVLNIVTIRDGDTLETATVNLIGPIVINKNTLQGRQVIVSNYHKYSARHPLLSEEANG